MRTTMKVLAAVVLFSAACGGTDSGTGAASRYSLDGRWVVSDKASNTIVGIMRMDTTAKSGSYGEGYTGYPAYSESGPIFAQLGSLTFDGAKPDFSVTFTGPSGTRTVTGALDADSHSGVFYGTVGAAPVVGVWFGAH